MQLDQTGRRGQQARRVCVCRLGENEVGLGSLTSEVFVRVAVVCERDPHPGHLLGDSDVRLAVGTAEGVWIAVLRVA